MAASLLLECLKHIVLTMALNANSLSLTLLSKMASSNDATALWWTSLVVFFLTRIYPTIFGWKQYMLLVKFSTFKAPSIRRTSHLRSWSQAENHLSLIFEFLRVHFFSSTSTSPEKLDLQSTDCILLSCDNRAKDYRCYEPGTRKIIVLRDVHILESSKLELPVSDESSKILFP